MYSIDLNRKDRAKRYHKSSIFNRQYSIPALPGWDPLTQTMGIGHHVSYTKKVIGVNKKGKGALPLSLIDG
jgi:hypothetical protein